MKIDRQPRQKKPEAGSAENPLDFLGRAAVSVGLRVKIVGEEIGLFIDKIAVGTKLRAEGHLHAARENIHYTYGTLYSRPAESLRALIAAADDDPNMHHRFAEDALKLQKETEEYQKALKERKGDPSTLFDLELTQLEQQLNSLSANTVLRFRNYAFHKDMMVAHERLVQMAKDVMPMSSGLFDDLQYELNEVAEILNEKFGENPLDTYPPKDSELTPLEQGEALLKDEQPNTPEFNKQYLETLARLKKKMNKVIDTAAGKFKVLHDRIRQELEALRTWDNASRDKVPPSFQHATTALDTMDLRNKYEQLDLQLFAVQQRLEDFRKTYNTVSFTSIVALSTYKSIEDSRKQLAEISETYQPVRERIEGIEQLEKAVQEVKEKGIIPEEVRAKKKRSPRKKPTKAKAGEEAAKVEEEPVDPEKVAAIRTELQGKIEMLKTVRAELRKKTLFSAVAPKGYWPKWPEALTVFKERLPQEIFEVLERYGRVLGNRPFTGDDKTGILEILLKAQREYEKTLRPYLTEEDTKEAAGGAR